MSDKKKYTTEEYIINELINIRAEINELENKFTSLDEEDTLNWLQGKENGLEDVLEHIKQKQS